MTREKWEVAASVVDVGQEGLCHDECYTGLGGVQVCVVDECTDGVVSVVAVGGPVVEVGENPMLECKSPLPTKWGPHLVK